MTHSGERRARIRWRREADRRVCGSKTDLVEITPFSSPRWEEWRARLQVGLIPSTAHLYGLTGDELTCIGHLLHPAERLQSVDFRSKAG